MAVINMGHGKHWLKPPDVSAPDQNDRAKTVIYKVSDVFLYQMAAVGRLSPIFQMWAHVVGELPPINNVSRLERGPVKPSLMTLADSVACFQGVNRPYNDEESGDSVLVYVLNPAVTIEKDASLVCLAKAVKMPAGTALTVQVKPSKILQNGDKSIYAGVVTRSENVFAEGNPLLPARSNTRYRKRLW